MYIFNLLRSLSENAMFLHNCKCLGVINGRFNISYNVRITAHIFLRALQMQDTLKVSTVQFPKCPKRNQSLKAPSSALLPSPPPFLPLSSQSSEQLFYIRSWNITWCLSASKTAGQLLFLPPGRRAWITVQVHSSEESNLRRCHQPSSLKFIVHTGPHMGALQGKERDKDVNKAALDHSTELETACLVESTSCYQWFKLRQEFSAEHFYFSKIAHLSKRYFFPGLPFSPSWKSCVGDLLAPSVAQKDEDVLPGRGLVLILVSGQWISINVDHCRSEPVINTINSLVVIQERFHSI